MSSGGDPNAAGDRDTRPELNFDDLAGLVRFGATAWFKTAQWAVSNYAGGVRRLIGAAGSPEEAADLRADMGEAARSAARDFASVGGVGEKVRSAVPEGSVVQRVANAVDEATRPRGQRGPTGPSLRDLGAELLYKSADVNYDASAHPAYARIIGELAPDEGRILRLLFHGGPQPAVDIRTGGPIGVVNSRLIASGFSMIGPRAGLRHVDQVPSYLNNLFRLGLVWFSRETLRDPLPYQVVEAQPAVLAAMHSMRFPKIVRRSIHLTPFGEDFCRDCLSIEHASPLDEVPAHSAPTESVQAGQPPSL